ncbi:hypothetical protein RchiOBHm_Chr1g0313391 [Rosa chinensis]|uniref:Uncharacterized protein n=1 Tax=Rosa chinensis TaxID=74649 RepID=A0A2P6S6V4_ROSCH|nr:hypothetical protein RchiOBHm_Chr1g0313391 [Rosa chinensis]
MCECYIHGNTTKYLQVPDGVVPSGVALVYQEIEQQRELDDLVYIFRLCGFKL